MPSSAAAVYDRLDADVATLLSYHPTVASPGVGRPPGDTGPLLRSAVVLIHTAWENYLEQVVLEAAQHVFAVIGDDHSLLPGGLKHPLTDRAKKEDPWLLAGDGWKSAGKDRVTAVIDRLNTPNSEAVEELCAKFLGIPSVLDGCGWQNKPPQAVRADLDILVHDVRGEIVHKGRTDSSLTLGGVRSWRDFCGRLVQRLDVHLSESLLAQFGSRPWLA